MFMRILSATAAGLTITAGLLFLMQYLIEVSEAVESPPVDKYDLAFLPKIDDTPVKKMVLPPTRPNPPPVEPRHRPPIDSGGEFIPVGPAPVVDPPAGNSWRPTSITYTDGGLMTIVSVQPHYPQKASGRGLEGHVLVRFDVTEMGTVTNVQVVESSSRLFNKAAIDAAKRFRFKPKIVDGAAQMSFGVQRLFTFEMKKD